MTTPRGNGSGAGADIADQLVGLLHGLQDFGVDARVVVDALREIRRLLHELRGVVRCSGPLRKRLAHHRDDLGDVERQRRTEDLIVGDFIGRREARQLCRQDENAHDQRQADRLEEIEFEPRVLLDEALGDLPGAAVVLRFDDGTSHAEFTSGAAPDGASGVTRDLDGGWTVETLAVVASSEVLEDREALIVLPTGAAASLVLAALVLVLGTGRAAALRLVGERTGELRYQALHDALTSLPNRSLIMDRIEQLLARNRRNNTLGAALFIDLDDFKNVNDTLGHEAGDRLLMAVAARLTNTLRDADTIGRMGGDEFVVLIDGAHLKVAPELIAETQDVVAGRLGADLATKNEGSLEAGLAGFQSGAVNLADVANGVANEARGAIHRRDAEKRIGIGNGRRQLLVERADDRLRDGQIASRQEHQNALTGLTPEVQFAVLRYIVDPGIRACVGSEDQSAI